MATLKYCIELAKAERASGEDATTIALVLKHKGATVTATANAFRNCGISREESAKAILEAWEVDALTTNDSHNLVQRVRDAVNR
jgi:hypothetical protein